MSKTQSVGFGVALAFMLAALFLAVTLIGQARHEDEHESFCISRGPITVCEPINARPDSSAIPPRGLDQGPVVGSDAEADVR